MSRSRVDIFRSRCGEREGETRCSLSNYLQTALIPCVKLTARHIIETISRIKTDHAHFADLKAAHKCRMCVKFIASTRGYLPWKIYNSHEQCGAHIFCPKPAHCSRAGLLMRASMNATKFPCDDFSLQYSAAPRPRRK